MAVHLPNWWIPHKPQKSPDFRRKCSQEVLGRGVDGHSHPPMLKAELAPMMKGGAQSDDCPFYDQLTESRVDKYEYHSRSASLEGPTEAVDKSALGTCVDVRALCKAGRSKEALHVLNQKGIQADSHTYICVLQECINMQFLAEGKQVHAHIIRSGFKPNIFLLNTLVNMYAKCRSVVDARRVFDKMPERDVSTWNIMIAGYAKHGCGREALDLYEQMIQKGVMPKRVTFICVLKACANLGMLKNGLEIHADIVRAGTAPDIILETALVDMYAKCGSMKDAHQIFGSMTQRNVVSWSAMIAGYARCGCGREAFDIYEQMIQEGVMPNKVTFICVLNACAILGALEKGKEVHAHIIKADIPSDIVLDNTLIDMYAKCGSIEDARQIFENMAKRDVVSWTTMMAGYVQHGCGSEAFKIYEQMIQEGVTLNRVTFTSILTACASLGLLENGREVHADMIKAGIAPDVILENTLVHMYAKCGSIKDARQVFSNMDQRNVVSWSAMIAGYAQHGCGEEAFDIYDQMICEGVTPNNVTFICILKACASLAALEKGIEVHADIVKAAIAPDVIVETALADMYAKCGSMKDARRVFDNMPQQNVVSWNAIIAGYGQHGCGKEALLLFEQMQHEGFKPEVVTFISLLSACSHVGLVDEGLHYFHSMSDDHGLTPTVEHFGCVVDLLGRAGRLDEAEDFIDKIPSKPGASVWGALLAACRVHGNVELAERAAKCLLELDPQDATTYVVLSNIYAAAGRWVDTAKVRKMMEARGIKKEPGRSCVEVKNQVPPSSSRELSGGKLF